MLKERKNKANLEMRRERLRLNQVKLLSPMSGLVAIRQNRGGGFFVSGMPVPDIREGDQVQPGMPVADVLDLSELEVIANIGELDRANLKEGQEVILTLDALADKRLHGKIKSMSGTASANIFSSDPAKKFEVLFSIDMKELLTHLGAKPDQIAKVLAQAEANRKKPVAAAAPMMAFGGGMPGGPGGPGMVMMGPGGGAPAGGGGEGGPRMGFNRGGGAGGPGGGEGAAAMSPEQQQKMREIFQKVMAGQNMREMSPEDRQKMMQKVQDELKKAGITAPAGMGGGRGGRGGQAGEGRGEAGGQGGERAARGEGRGGRGQGGEGRGEGGGQAGAQGGERAARGEGRGGRGGGRGEGGEGGGRGGEGGPAMPGFGGARQFSEQDLNNAKLPPPPEDDNQLDVLLRPGLLADVEIIVEKIPNAIHVPTQAVFEKETEAARLRQRRDALRGARDQADEAQREHYGDRRRAEGRRSGCARRSGRQTVGKKGEKKSSSGAIADDSERQGRTVVMSSFSGVLPEIYMGLCEPLGPQAAQLADDARHDLRRGRGGGDAVDHGRRAERDDELHRSARCQQHHHRSQGSRRPQ